MTSRSIAVPGPKFSLVLSHWDRRAPPVHSKRVLCFSLPESYDIARVTDLLYQALQATVKELPFLGGSVVPGDLPWLRKILPQGAAYLDIKDLIHEIKYSDLQKTGFPQSLLDAETLCSLPKAAYVQEGPVDVCRLQANFVEGGLLLVVQVIHIACDGSGITELIKRFAENLIMVEQKKTDSVEHGDATGVWSFDRTSDLSGNRFPGDIENHTAWTVSSTDAHSRLVDQKTICQTFRISRDGLLALKHAASASPPSSANTTWVSTHDAIVAFLWHNVMLARRRVGALSNSEKLDTYLTQPFDCRKLLPHLPQPYYGNVLYSIRAALPYVDLAASETGLGAAAYALRGEISAVTEDKFRDSLALFERVGHETHVRLKLLDDLASGEGFIVTSYWGMDLYDLDFGEVLGQMDAVRLPSAGLPGGMHVVLPRLRDGACEVMVAEQQAVMEALLKDNEWSQFAKSI